MPSQAEMKATLKAYIDHFNAGDAEKLTSLFADDATVEDPVGSPPHKGKAAILAFYQDAMKNGAQLSLSAPVRGSHGNAAAMAFEAKIGNLTVRIIDVMTFNADGKVASMQAYFGPEDFIQG
jgi:steroid delta-isomerase